MITAFNNVENICYLHRYLVTFLFKAFSVMVPRNSKLEIVLPTYQPYNSTYIIKK